MEKLILQLIIQIAFVVDHLIKVQLEIENIILDIVKIINGLDVKVFFI